MLRLLERLKSSGSDPKLILLVLAALSVVAQTPEPEESDPPPVVDDAVLDAWYPRTITGPNGSIIVQAPQVDAWDDFTTLVAWTAFTARRTGSDTSWVGSLKFSATTDTDIAAREVLLHDFKILEMSINGLAEDSPEYRLTREGVTALSRKIPLDLVLEYLPRDLKLDAAGELNPEPPLIFVSERPAVLLSVAGEPIFVPAGAGDLQFVLNTNWDVLRVGDDGTLYLCYESQAWLTATDIAGPWTWARSLSPGIRADTRQHQLDPHARLPAGRPERRRRHPTANRRRCSTPPSRPSCS